MSARQRYYENLLALHQEKLGPAEMVVFGKTIRMPLTNLLATLREKGIDFETLTAEWMQEEEREREQSRAAAPAPSPVQVHVPSPEAPSSAPAPGAPVEPAPVKKAKKVQRPQDVFWMPDDVTEQGLSFAVLGVFTILCRNADADGVAYVGIRRIAKLGRSSKRTVEKALDELVLRQMIARDVRANGDRAVTVVQPRERWLTVPDVRTVAESDRPPCEDGERTPTVP